MVILISSNFNCFPTKKFKILFTRRVYSCISTHLQHAHVGFCDVIQHVFLIPFFFLWEHKISFDGKVHGPWITGKFHRNRICNPTCVIIILTIYAWCGNENIFFPIYVTSCRVWKSKTRSSGFLWCKLAFVAFLITCHSVYKQSNRYYYYNLHSTRTTERLHISWGRKKYERGEIFSTCWGSRSRTSPPRTESSLNIYHKVDRTEAEHSPSRTTFRPSVSSHETSFRTRPIESIHENL